MLSFKVMENINAEVSNFTLAPAGNQALTCIGLYILGTLNEEYQGHKKKVKKLMLAFELNDTNHVFKEGEPAQPFVMHKDFTNNLGSTSNLRKFIDQWAGQKLTDADAKTFNLANLVGFSGLGNVVHDKKKKDGSDIALIIGMSPLPASMAKPISRMPHKIFNINKVPFDDATFKTLPEWIQKKIQGSDEYLALANAGNTTTTTPVAQTQQSVNPFGNQPLNGQTAAKLF